MIDARGEVICRTDRVSKAVCMIDSRAALVRAVRVDPAVESFAEKKLVRQLLAWNTHAHSYVWSLHQHGEFTAELCAFVECVLVCARHGRREVGNHARQRHMFTLI